MRMNILVSRSGESMLAEISWIVAGMHVQCIDIGGPQRRNDFFLFA